MRFDLLTTHMKRLLLLLLVVLCFAEKGRATHNRAGEITYRHLSGLTYEITITTYTKASSIQADRCELDLNFGDGTSAIVPRSNGPSSVPCPGRRAGILLGNDVRWNQYVTTHTFPSTGRFKISMEDPNRNENVLNIPGSINVIFYIESEIFISATGTPNSSPQLTNPPIDNACLFEIYEHNPGAVDQDLASNGFSDSLSYEIVECLGANGARIPGFVQPNQIGSGTNNILNIDPITGTLTWAVPQRAGEYNVAILISEWRILPSGDAIQVGSILRDMQIEAFNCDNQPPDIINARDTCVQAGSTLQMTFTAVDPDRNNAGNPVHDVTIEATGDPFTVQGNQATFPRNTGFGSVSSLFSWSPECIHVARKPYQTVIRAEDSNPATTDHIQLTDYESFEILVVGPPPVDELATPQGSGINLDWRYDECTNVIGYRIYRRVDSAGFVPSACVTGVPPGLGYQLIATITDPTVTDYHDDNNGRGLNHGLKYCYMVYAIYPDGAESYASFEFCSTLRRDVPIITRVSVNTTDVANGSDSVEWAKPTELDQSLFPGPYQYRILRRAQLGTFSQVGVTNTDADLDLVDTVFVDQNLNTLDLQYGYRIELLSNGTVVGTSTEASSVFTQAGTLDNRVMLSWSETVPWVNSSYEVKREVTPGNFVILDTVFVPTYTDTGLVNGETYCYVVTSIGAYSVPGFIDPIRNNSQEICAIPTDRQEPCPPSFTLFDADCDLFENRLRWTNPNTQCDTVDDVFEYRVYYKPFLNTPFQLLQSVPGAENNELVLSSQGSVAGCYAISAIDTAGNESPLSDSLCADNCPIYELPNVFTPGGDGNNDVLRPFPYRYVERVDMKIYNRWGELVFETNDPDIEWDGRHKNSNEESADGVYFYVCTVYEIRLQGLVPRILKGHVTLLNQSSQFSND